jgi:hypothetical protein
MARRDEREQTIIKTKWVSGVREKERGEKEETMVLPCRLLETMRGSSINVHCVLKLVIISDPLPTF